MAAALRTPQDSMPTRRSHTGSGTERQKNEKKQNKQMIFEQDAPFAVDVRR
jgi:hypothetical protein